MFLDINNDKSSPMKLVFSLHKKLENEPDLILKAQNLTLNEKVQHAGLKGVNGLYGSDEWWDNIRNNVIEKIYVEGIIINAYEVGMDKHGVPNTIDVKCSDGEILSFGIYVNNECYKNLFVDGALIKVSA